MVFKLLMHFYLGFTFSMSAQAKDGGGLSLSATDWASCEKELASLEFPRACFTLSALSVKLGYVVLYTRIENHCLKNIEHWTPIEPADQTILNMYFPKCFYRMSVLQNEKPERLNIQLEKQNLVRFLYMKSSNDKSHPNPKRLSGPSKTWSGLK